MEPEIIFETMLPLVGPPEKVVVLHIAEWDLDAPIYNEFINLQFSEIELDIINQFRSR